MTSAKRQNMKRGSPCGRRRHERFLPSVRLMSWCYFQFLVGLFGSVTIISLMIRNVPRISIRVDREQTNATIHDIEGYWIYGGQLGINLTGKSEVSKHFSVNKNRNHKS